MNIPLVCDCGVQLRVSVDTETKKLVAVCLDCGQAFDLVNCTELKDETIEHIKARFMVSEMDKKLSFMVKRVPQ